MNGDLVQGVEPSSPARNHGRRRSRGRIRRRAVKDDAWPRPPRFSPRPVSVKPARMRVLLPKDSRHEGHRDLGGAQALPTRNGPCRWKASAIRVHHRPSHGVGSANLGGSRPGGPTRRRDNRSDENRQAGEATRTSEVDRIGRAGDNTPAHGCKPQTGANAIRRSGARAL